MASNWPDGLPVNAMSSSDDMLVRDKAASALTFALGKILDNLLRNHLNRYQPRPLVSTCIFSANNTISRLIPIGTRPSPASWCINMGNMLQ